MSRYGSTDTEAQIATPTADAANRAGRYHGRKETAREGRQGNRHEPPGLAGGRSTHCRHSGESGTDRSGRSASVAVQEDDGEEGQDGSEDECDGEDAAVAPCRFVVLCAGGSPRPCQAMAAIAAPVAAAAAAP